MIGRLLGRLVMMIPACQEVSQGMADARDGLLPRSAGYYYRGGWEAGIRLRPDHGTMDAQQGTQETP